MIEEREKQQKQDKTNVKIRYNKARPNFKGLHQHKKNSQAQQNNADQNKVTSKPICKHHKKTQIAVV